MFVFRTFDTVGKPSFYCLCLVINWSVMRYFKVRNYYGVETNTEIMNVNLLTTGS